MRLVPESPMPAHVQCHSKGVVVDEAPASYAVATPRLRHAIRMLEVLVLVHVLLPIWITPNAVPSALTAPDPAIRLDVALLSEGMHIRARVIVPRTLDAFRKHRAGAASLVRGSLQGAMVLSFILSLRQGNSGYRCC